MNFKQFSLYAGFMFLLLMFLKKYQEDVARVFSQKYLTDEELSRDVRQIDHKLIAEIRTFGMLRRGGL